MFQLQHNEDDDLHHLHYLVNLIYHILNNHKKETNQNNNNNISVTFQDHHHFHQKKLLHLIKNKKLIQTHSLHYFLPVIPVNRLLFKKCINKDEFIRAISVHKPAVPLQTCLCILSKPCTTAKIELITNANFGSSL